MLFISFPYFLLKNYKRRYLTRMNILLPSSDVFYYLNLSILSGTLSESILCYLPLPTK